MNLKKLYLITYILFTLILFGCNNNKSENEITSNKQNNENPEFLYELAVTDIKNEELDNAKLKLEKIEKDFPLSNRAIQSKVMLAFIEYLKLNYNEAIYKLNSIINIYPSYKDLDYVYYMKALCYYEQINHESLEGKNNQEALNAFEQVINRYPNSKYSKDSNQKIILIKENIAAKHMNIGFFYLKKEKYLASINRYNIVINEYSQTKFTPEALYRLLEIYYSLGMNSEAEKTFFILKYNYSNSEWYKYSLNLFNKDEKKSLYNKIINLLNKDG